MHMTSDKKKNHLIVDQSVFTITYSLISIYTFKCLTERYVCFPRTLSLISHKAADVVYNDHV